MNPGGVRTDTYRVTVNSFLAGGGDGFTVLTQGTQAVNQPGFDVDALEDYLSG
jgi:5'-nucleotidase